MPQLSHKQVTLSSPTVPPFEGSAGGAEGELRRETEGPIALAGEALSASEESESAGDGGDSIVDKELPGIRVQRW